jgi:transposase-like protein
MQCTHCGSLKYVKNGCPKGIQNYRCKECTRYFSDRVRKFTFADKKEFMELYLNGYGIRKAAKKFGCSHSLLLRWIREFATLLKKQTESVVQQLDANTIPDVIEMDEIYTRVKKGDAGFQYGLLLVDSDVKLLRIK